MLLWKYILILNLQKNILKQWLYSGQSEHFYFSILVLLFMCLRLTQTPWHFWSHKYIFSSSSLSTYLSHPQTTTSNYKSHLNSKPTFCDTRYPWICGPDLADQIFVFLFSWLLLKISGYRFSEISLKTHYLRPIMRLLMKILYNFPANYFFTCLSLCMLEEKKT